MPRNKKRKVLTVRALRLGKTYKIVHDGEANGYEGTIFTVVAHHPKGNMTLHRRDRFVEAK